MKCNVLCSFVFLLAISSAHADPVPYCSGQKGGEYIIGCNGDYDKKKADDLVQTLSTLPDGKIDYVWLTPGNPPNPLFWVRVSVAESQDSSKLWDQLQFLKDSNDFYVECNGSVEH